MNCDLIDNDSTNVYKLFERDFQKYFLVHLKWYRHFKCRYDSFKWFLIITIFHLVSAIHFANFRTQVATTYILV